MFVGFVLFVVGAVGRRKTVITNVVQVSNTPGQGMQANIPLDYNEQRSTPMRTVEPRVDLPRSRDESRMISPPVIDVTPREPQAQNAGYNRAKWKALVQYDPDISRVVKALEGYDQKYTDEFATAYLTLNDKAYLPMIVNKILETAKLDAATRKSSARA